MLVKQAVTFLKFLKFSAGNPDIETLTVSIENL